MVLTTFIPLNFTDKSSFSQTLRVGNVGINTNFIFLFTVFFVYALVVVSKYEIRDQGNTLRFVVTKSGTNVKYQIVMNSTLITG